MTHPHPICSACESAPSVIVRNGSPLCGPCDCEAARCDECGEGVEHDHAPECSICRRRHGLEIIHACE